MFHDPLVPGAAAIAQSTLHLHEGVGIAGTPEMPLPNRRRVDIVALGPKGDGVIVADGFGGSDRARGRAHAAGCSTATGIHPSICSVGGRPSCRSAPLRLVHGL